MFPLEFRGKVTHEETHAYAGPEKT